MKTYVLYPTEEQEKIVKDFLESNSITFFKDDEALPEYVLAGILKGQEDIKAGRFITHKEFKKRIASSR